MPTLALRPIGKNDFRDVVGFDDPIELPNGQTLITLRDAGNYVAALPKKEHALPRPKFQIISDG